MKSPFLAGLVACLVCGCASRPRIDNRPIGEGTLTLAFQSNRAGSLEPCGCQSKPYGGLDRELNALDALSKTSEVLFVDAGNLLAPFEPKSTPAQSRAKAKALWEMEKLMKLSVFAPGPADLLLGVPFLESLAGMPGAPLFVSTNVVDASGKPVFAPFQVRKVSGVRVAFLSATPATKGIEATPAHVALRRWLPEAAKSADIVVVLSQLGANEDEKLMEAFPAIHLVVGADPKVALQRPLWFAGGRLLVDPASEGTFLGNLTLKVKLPFKGFSSPSLVAETVSKLAYWKGRESEPQTVALAKREIKRLQEQQPTAPIEGGSDFQHELIGLDAERFGKPNPLTKMREEEKARVRREALSE